MLTDDDGGDAAEGDAARLLLPPPVDPSLLPLNPWLRWLPEVAGPLRRGAGYVLTGDVELCRFLAVQIAVDLASSEHRTLAFAMGVHPKRLAERLIVHSPDAGTDAAMKVLPWIRLTSDAGDLRDLRFMIDLAVRNRQPEQCTALVVLDRVALAGRTRAVERAAEDFSYTLAACARAGTTVLAIASGADDAVRTLAAQAASVWHLQREGDRVKFTCRSGGGPEATVVLESDPVTGGFRRAADTTPFVGQAVYWTGDAETPLAQAQAILRPARELGRSRLIGHGLPDRRVELALTLLGRVPQLGVHFARYDAEVLLPAGTSFAASGLAVAVAAAGSVLRRELPENVVCCGDVGLNRTVQRPPALLAESLEALSAAGECPLTSRHTLLVDPATAVRLRVLECRIVPTLTLDAALRHLWPDLVKEQQQ